MRSHFILHTLLILGLPMLLGGCGNGEPNGNPDAGTGGPANAGTPVQHQLGDVTAGQDVYRFETFGNERFWTDAVRLPEGMMEAKVTPLQALKLGLHVDIDALDAATQGAIAEELQTDPTGETSPLLNDPDTTVALVNANAIIGLAAKDSNENGVIDITDGDRVGASCALCHTVTNGSALEVPNGGSIGRRQDGRATHSLDFGSLLAAGTNSRAYYPVLQLALDANGGKTLGRAPTGLTENSTEEEVDTYLTNKDFYPVGMFDDTVDGNGDPMHNMPLFRQDLAFPYGSEGAISKQDNFANLVYTVLLDPTTLTTEGGRAFLNKLGGDAAGKEIVEDYLQVLEDTGVTGYPFVQATPPTDPADAGTEAFPIGLRVDNTKLLDLNAYLFNLQAPPGIVTDAGTVERGRELFRTVGCTGCHNVDQGKFVPTFIVPMKTIFPGDNPVVLLAQRDPPLNPIVNTPGDIFDDKMAVVNASQRGLERGVALPLLLDLARKPVFLHDNSVATLEDLLNQSRGSAAPHPFYLSDGDQRSDMIEFLNSLDTSTE